MECVDDIGSRPAALSYVPVQSSSCSLRVFYRTLVVGKDTYYTPLIIIIIRIKIWELKEIFEGGITIFIGNNWGNILGSFERPNLLQVVSYYNVESSYTVFFYFFFNKTIKISS